jgi:hypothetical protein
MTNCEVVHLPDSGTIAWNSVWLAIERDVNALIAQVASINNLSERDLRICCRLHFPRFKIEELKSESTLRKEVDRLAAWMLQARSQYTHLTPLPTTTLLQRGSARFALVEPHTARIIHQFFHYVGSFREGFHFGLFDHASRGPSELPVAMATLSALDVEHLRYLMHQHGECGEGMILSRVYSFDYAWHNSISYLLGKLVGWLQANLPEVRTLFTYVNPNLGFTGVSYRASNWTEVGEKTISYRYIAGNYASARQCQAVHSYAPSLVKRATYLLLPLKIWSYNVTGPEKLPSIKTTQAKT